jgi:hypothetical protein
MLRETGTIGPDATFQDLQNLDSESISTGIGATYEVDVTPGMFSPLSGSLLNSILPSTYSPIMDYGSSSRAGELTQSLAGGTASKSYGGFAESIGQKGFTSKVKDVYGKSMTDLLSQQLASKQKAYGGLTSAIDQYRQTALELKA